MNSWGIYSTGLAGYAVRVSADGESVTWYYDAGNNKEKKLHSSKIYFSRSGRPYFRARGVNIYLDECLRIDIAS